MKTEIVFRQINSPVPGNWTPGVHWQVECHDGRLPHPIGIAWVSHYGCGASFCPILDYVLVCDQFRRKGIASLLIRACKKRWPELYVAESVLDAGAALLESLRNRGVEIDY